MPRNYNKRYRKRKANKRRSVTTASVSRALNPHHQYQNEYRADTIDSTQNYIKWGVIPYSMNSNTSSPSPDQIITGAGQETPAYVKTDIGYKVRIHQQNLSIHFRNLSNHPCYFTVYQVLAKMDIPGVYGVGTINNAPEAVIQALYEGWNQYIEASKANTTGTGSIVVYTLGNTYLETTARGLCISKSPFFNQHFKVTKKTKYRMEPGDDVFESMTAPHMDWSGSDYANDAGAVEARPLVEAGKTKFMLYQIHGALGKSISNDGNIGFMTTDIGYEAVFRAKVYRLGLSERNWALQTPTVDTLTDALEGPAEHTHAQENL